MLTVLSERFPPGHFSRQAAPGQRRAIAANVMVYFAFALAALVFLTKSAVAANAINREVAVAIAPTTVSIDARTSKLARLDTTVHSTAGIAAGTRSLSTHLGHVVKATDHINSNLTATSSDVDEIGASVTGINTSVAKIRPEIFTLSASVGGIHAKAGDVSSRLATVADDTAKMPTALAGINASLASVLTDTRPLSSDVSGIHRTLLSVQGHTASIANSPILLSAFPFPNLPLPDLLNQLGLGDVGLNTLLGGGVR